MGCASSSPVVAIDSSKRPDKRPDQQPERTNDPTDVTTTATTATAVSAATAKSSQQSQPPVTVALEMTPVDSFGFVRSALPTNDNAPLNDEWRAAMFNPAMFRSQNPQRFRSIVLNGVPSRCRPILWADALGRPPMPAPYAVLVLRPCADSRQILLDIGRTFPHHSFVATPQGQQVLLRMLSALCNARPDVGYVQGMNFIAATFLVACDFHEVRAFELLFAFMTAPRFNMIELYRDGLTKLQVVLSRLDALFASRETIATAPPASAVAPVSPPSTNALLRCGVTAALFAQPYFLTSFVYNFKDASALYRLWDCLILLLPGNEMTEAILRVALSLMTHLSPATSEGGGFDEIVQRLQRLDLPPPRLRAVCEDALDMRLPQQPQTQTQPQPQPPQPQPQPPQPQPQSQPQPRPHPQPQQQPQPQTLTPTQAQTQMQAQQRQPQPATSTSLLVASPPPLASSPPLPSSSPPLPSSSPPASASVPPSNDLHPHRLPPLESQPNLPAAASSRPLR